MFESQIKQRYQFYGSRVSQGDILRDVAVNLGFDKVENNSSEVEAEEHIYNYAIVLSQDCDLESDYRERTDNAKKKPENISHDKYLPTILICPAYLFSDFLSGIHITNWRMNDRLKPKAEDVKRNNSFKRYHYLPGDTSFGVPDLILDFKHFVTIPRDALYKIHKDVYVSTIGELFREELSQRFSNFLSRIGLPII